MNVSLTKELEKFVHELVRQGRYGSASEVVRDGLRLVEEHEILRQAKLDWLRKAIKDGEESVQRYGWIDGEGAFQRLRTRVAKQAMKKRAQSATRGVRRRAG